MTQTKPSQPFSVVALFVIIGLLFPPGGRCGEAGILLVFGMEDQGGVLASGTLKNLASRLAELLSGCGHQVIPPAEIADRLQKLAPKNQGAGRIPKRPIEVARSLGAGTTLLTKIERTDDRCRIEGYLFNLQQASVEKTTRLEAGCDEKALWQAMPALAAPLCQHLQAGSQAERQRRHIREPTPGQRDDPFGDALSTMTQIAEQESAASPTEPPGGQVLTRELEPEGAGKPARVSILTEPPGAQVFWDGKPLGRAPLRVEQVKPGWHRLALQHPGYLSHQASLNVTSSIEMQVGLFEERRKVRLNTEPPGAEVCVDGRPSGRTPAEVSLAADGQHRIVATLKDYQETFMEFVPKPATAAAPAQEVTLKLIPQPVYVFIQVSPLKAKVVIGEGSDREQIVGSGTVGIIPGKKKVVASLEGYQTLTQEVEFPVGRSSELSLVLVPNPAYLAYRQALRSKRFQTWPTLGASVLAVAVAWPMIKWSYDSQRASDRWYLAYTRAPDEQQAKAALSKSRSFDDRAEWTAIVGYTAVGIGAVALGWSLYSFFTYPQKPQSLSAAPLLSPAGSGGLMVLVGSF